MQRFAAINRLIPELKEKYLKEHASVWPEVNAMISACNIRNFSIYIRTLPDGRDYLFMYYEYHGNDHAADMAKMAADPTTQEWWSVVNTCHEPLPDRADGEWWASMDEVCHHD